MPSNTKDDRVRKNEEDDESRRKEEELATFSTEILPPHRPRVERHRGRELGLQEGGLRTHYVGK